MDEKRISSSPHHVDEALDHWYDLAKRIAAITHVAYQAGGLPAILLLYRIRDLILRQVSHLDAFSGYLCQTLATQRCRWHDNWHTRGLSTPVLSY